MTTAERTTLRCVPPFDFGLSTMVFSDGDGQIRKYENGKFWQVIRIDDGLVLTTVQSLGTVEGPKLSVELRSNYGISESEKKEAREMVGSLFDTRLDLGPFYEHAKRDKVLTGLIQRLRGLKGPTTATVFEALVDSVIEQQISLNVAHVLETRLIKTFGEAVGLKEGVFYAYPTPQKLASATLSQLRKCGLSERKAEYLSEISKMVEDGDLNLEGFKLYDNAQDIISELDGVRGIGVWTAELTVARSMHKYEVIPADDLGLRRVISHYYRSDRKISGEEARRIAENWGRWKGLAAFYLIVAEAKERTEEATL